MTVRVLTRVLLSGWLETLGLRTPHYALAPINKPLLRRTAKCLTQTIRTCQPPRKTEATNCALEVSEAEVEGLADKSWYPQPQLSELHEAKKRTWMGVGLSELQDSPERVREGTSQSAPPPEPVPAGYHPE